jgi:hypothetical protein
MYLFLIIIFILAFVLGCLIREVEYANDNEQLAYLLNAFWLTSETVFAIGYGEMIPHDHFGRFIMVFICGVSLYLVGYLILVINQKFILDGSERN